MSPHGRDYYALLGVPTDASPADIKLAFRARARDLHPDRNPSEAALEDFKAVNEAYRVLSDAEARRRYDRFGMRPDGSVYGAVAVPPAPPSFSDVARAVARGVRRAVRPRGRDITIEVNLAPFDMIRGSRRIFSLPRTGRRGQVEMRRLEFRLPPGLRDGQRLCWRGEGEPSDDNELPPGHLWVVIRLSAGPWTVRGADLVLPLPIRPSQALAGCRVRAETAEGGEPVVVPPGSRDGSVVRLEGRGLHSADGVRGALEFRVRVVWPALEHPGAVEGLRGWEAGLGASAFPETLREDGE
jgi:DnaJ-class molecular chaperone